MPVIQYYVVLRERGGSQRGLGASIAYRRRGGAGMAGMAGTVWTARDRWVRGESAGIEGTRGRRSTAVWGACCEAIDTKIDGTVDGARATHGTESRRGMTGPPFVGPTLPPLGETAMLSLQQLKYFEYLSSSDRLGHPRPPTHRPAGSV
jgi:hypothetical protein